MDPGDGSMDGWSWALQGRVTNTETITQQINYAFVNRGLSYESEGTNRNVPVNLAHASPSATPRPGSAGTTNYSTATAACRAAPPTCWPGTGNHASADAPFGDAGRLHLQRRAAGGRHRAQLRLPREQHRQHRHHRRAGARSVRGRRSSRSRRSIRSLAPLTDVYFRGYDQNYPDLWRYNEWKREFDQFVANGQPAEPVAGPLQPRPHGQLRHRARRREHARDAASRRRPRGRPLGRRPWRRARYAADTLIIVTEDDCQDGPDHVDSHRATAYIVGPYVKQGAVVSTHYSQVNALRTIEDILGTQHINLNTAFQRPMTDVFDIHSSGDWSYTAKASTVLSTTTVAQGPAGFGDVKYASGPVVKPKHDARYWAKLTAGFDFSEADHVSPGKFNRVIWRGLKGNKPYPAMMGAHREGRQLADADND